MGRAQERNAAVSGKFFFRKDVLPAGQSVPPSVASSSGKSSPCGDRKEKKLRNCFDPLPVPVNGVDRGHVNEEYEEMSMNEIINGKEVRFLELYPYYHCP
jgi:glutamate--cysteine ligase catalytic subunit